MRVPKFGKFVTDEQKADAFIMKQDRLVREETAAVQRQSRSLDGEPTEPRRHRAKAKAKAAADGTTL